MTRHPIPPCRSSVTEAPHSQYPVDESIIRRLTALKNPSFFSDLSNFSAHNWISTALPASFNYSLAPCFGSRAEKRADSLSVCPRWFRGKGKGAPSSAVIRGPEKALARLARRNAPVWRVVPFSVLAFEISQVSDEPTTSQHLSR